ncbi:MAG TPA: hypothetical protein VHY82_04225 [Acetobacteraceae bacterium]|nr:hypothetical protein [Acetobacteraceae bacterium]
MSTTEARPAEQSHQTQFVAANMFNFAGGGLHVSYSTSGIDGKPHLSYQDGFRSLSFSGNEIRAIECDLGTLLSVTIVRTVDAGSTSFSLLMPRVNLPAPFTSVSVSTEAVTAHHAFSIIPAFNHGQRDFYDVTPLLGTASNVVF